MEDLSLHILDIAENAIRANADKIIIRISDEKSNNKFILCIEDNGAGMTEKAVKKIIDPFYTTKKGKKTGLGLSLIYQAAQETGGDVKIDSIPGKGTKVTALFKPNHPDMKPMGDILETIKTLVISNPNIQFIYDHKKGDESLYFDSFKTT